MPSFSGGWELTGEADYAVLYRHWDYYSESENIDREQMGFSQGKEMKTLRSCKK